jgi:hypothetical protein
MQNHTDNSPSQQKFLRTLATSMHQMAQPISIIQASLELALLSPTSAEQYQEIATGLLQELQRAVECIQFTACLARFQQRASDVQKVSLSATLQDVISDLRRTFEAGQLHLLVFRSESEPLIRTSQTRLRQMFFYVLQAVQASSQPGDLVHIEIQEVLGHLTLRVKHDRSASDRADCAYPAVDDMVHRALALAEAIGSSAGGELSFTADLSLIVVEFPVESENRSAIGGREEQSDILRLQFALDSH